MLIELRDEDVGLASRKVSRWKQRSAARCVLRRGRAVALLHVRKYAYHKLPGGGVARGETLRAALRREVREEVGSHIRIGALLGSSREYRSRLKLRQVSACFLAAELAPGAPRFTRKERAKGFKVEWHPFGQVIVLLQRERPVDYEGKFIVKRDLRFLHEAAGVANK